MNRSIFIQNLWRWKCGLPEIDIDNPGRNIGKVDIDDLKQTEWSSRFEELMRNRLIIGALRYGRLKAKGKPQYDRVGSMIQRLKLYQESGNLEHLVDVANLALCEFEECHHPKKHFRAADDEVHTNPISNL